MVPEPSSWHRQPWTHSYCCALGAWHIPSSQLQEGTKAFPCLQAMKRQASCQAHCFLMLLKPQVLTRGSLSPLCARLAPAFAQKPDFLQFISSLVRYQPNTTVILFPFNSTLLRQNNNSKMPSFYCNKKIWHSCHCMQADPQRASLSHPVLWMTVSCWISVWAPGSTLLTPSR